MTRDIEAFLYRSITANGWVLKAVDEGVLEAPPARDDHDSSGTRTLSSFSSNARQQAGRMGRVYELLYCLENSVRELIEQTLIEELGADKWWSDGVPEPIRKSAERRKADDLKAPWHGARGESLLNYVDFPQYAEIICHRWDLFEGLMGDSDWVVWYFAEMNRSRRALAHTGQLSEEDVGRMELRVRDWLRAVG